MVTKVDKRRETALRYRTQRSECRKNVDEGLLVTRECVSLEVMPIFQMNGILLLKTSPDDNTKTTTRSSAFPQLTGRLGSAPVSRCATRMSV